MSANRVILSSSEDEESEKSRRLSGLQRLLAQKGSPSDTSDSSASALNSDNFIVFESEETPNVSESDNEEESALHSGSSSSGSAQEPSHAALFFESEMGGTRTTDSYDDSADTEASEGSCEWKTWILMCLADVSLSMRERDALHSTLVAAKHKAVAEALLRGDYNEPDVEGDGDVDEESIHNPLVRAVHMLVRKHVSHDAFSQVNDEAGRSMWRLMKSTWSDVERTLVRSTFHGKLGWGDLGVQIQDVLAALGSKRQMGASSRRQSFGLLQFDERRQKTLFEAIMTDAIRVRRMNGREQTYMCLATREWREFGVYDESTDVWAPPVLSDRELRHDRRMQYAFRRITCDSCQEWVDSATRNRFPVHLDYVVTLDTPLDDFVSMDPREYEDDDQAIPENSADDGEDDQVEDDAEKPFRAPSGVAQRSPSCLYVCGDCGHRMKTAIELISFLRLWVTAGPDILASSAGKANLREFCRLAAAATLVLVNFARRRILRTGEASFNARNSAPVRYAGEVEEDGEDAIVVRRPTNPTDVEKAPQRIPRHLLPSTTPTRIRNRSTSGRDPKQRRLSFKRGNE